MRGIGVIGRACAAVLGTAVLPQAVRAQDAESPGSTNFPEIRVIATTPASTPRPRIVVRPAASAAAEPGAIERDKIPANVQTLSAGDLDHAVAPGLLDALSRGLPGVTLGDQAGNNFQRDLDYRGFTASPVTGTPQGLAVYQNGVRINEVFGDTVNWDFIPEKAIDRITLVPGNPIYGLNALGGALAITMKNGWSYRGAEVEARGGSFGQRAGAVEAGGQSGNLSGYVAADAINDDGWRDHSPSRLRRIYGDVGARGEETEFHLTFTGASNSFGATAATPVELLARRWQSTYTVPQTTANDLAFLTGSARYDPTDTLSFQGNVYLRGFWQRHVDGNVSDSQACATDATLLCLGDGTTALTDAGGTPIRTSVLNGAVPGEIDRTRTATTSFGGSLQMANAATLFGRDNNLVIGASLDRGIAHFDATSELGTITPENFPFVTGTGVIINAPTGDVAPVSLRATTLYTGIYATDTLELTSRLALTAGGRFNIAQIKLQDRLGSALDGDHRFSRFNPVVGATYKITPELTAYAGYSEANRAPTPLELACADPARPCIIDNFLVSDPSLKQVVSHTYEAGLRGRFGSEHRLIWNVGAFHTRSSDDIINVASLIPGHGFFQNAGETLRQGVEAGISYKWQRWSGYANYSFVDATFQTPMTLSSPNNPFADANGNIMVTRGNRIPAVPQHRFKAGVNYQATDRLRVGADINVTGSQYLVGDQSNQNPQVPAYWLANLHGSYRLSKTVELFGLVTNLFNQRYYASGILFAPGQIPFLNLTDPRSFVPGMPLAVYGGLRASF